MPMQRVVERAVAAVTGRSVADLRRGLRRRARRLLRARRASGPLLSVVVPVYNVQDYLAECLDSVLSQTLVDLEVLVVDDGSTDACPQIIASYAARDSRVRAFRQANSGQGVARNLGVKHARGAFLAFLDADDTLPRDAYRYLVRTLQRSGSDFSVGSVRRVHHGERHRPFWDAPVHSRRRTGVTIDEFPDALQDVIACNRMFRTAFWRERVQPFRGGIAYEDHVPMVSAYVRAERFDVLDRVTYFWRVREDLSSTGQQKHSLRNLTDRIEVKAEALRLLQAEASARVLDSWVGRVLDIDLPPYIDPALGGTDAVRRTLQDALATYVALASPQAWARVRVHQKMRALLAAQGRWDDIETVQAYFRDVTSLPPTRALDGRVVADVDLPDELTRALPPVAFELSAAETVLRACLHRAAWIDDHVLELSGWALIRALDMRAGESRISLSLHEEKTGASVELPVDRRPDPAATRWSGQANAWCDDAAFRTRVDVAALVAAAPLDGTRSWRLRVHVEVSGVQRTGGLHQAVAGGSAARGALTSAVLASGVRAVPKLHGATGFTLTLKAPRVVCTSLSTEHGTRTVRGVLRVAEGSKLRPTSVRARRSSGEEEVSAPVEPRDEGLTFTLALPPAEGPVSWEVAVVAASGASTPLPWPAGEARRTLGDSEYWGEQHGGQEHGGQEHGLLVWRRDRSGLARLHADAGQLAVSAVTVGRDAIELVVQHPGWPAAAVSGIHLAGPLRGSLAPEAVLPQTPGTSLLRFPTRYAAFRGACRTALPSGTYTVEAVDRGGRGQQAQVADDLLPALPVELPGAVAAVTEALHGARATVAVSGTFQLTLGPPLADEERGKWAQAQLQRRYARHTPPIEPAWVFRNRDGRWADGDPRAVHDELRRRGCDLPVHWAVADLATPVPEGARPVLIGSRAWYEVLSTSAYLCSDTELPAHLRPADDQRFLRAFPEYPVTAVGRPLWEAEGLTPGQIARELARRAATWDAVVAADEHSARVYREGYEFPGPILVTGRPATDLVVARDRAKVRAHVLSALGLADDGADVVLWAPAAREESLAQRTYAPPRPTPAQAAELARLLPDGMVLLWRGDRLPDTGDSPAGPGATLVDVSSYPVLADLVLAADAAVLDHSALRFSWFLTGRPAVFLVPHLEPYLAARPQVIDFAHTAPGPIVRTLPDVAEALRDLPGLDKRYAAELATCNARFNAHHDGSAAARVLDAFLAGP